MTAASTGDVAALVLTVAAGVLVLALLATLVSMRATLRALRETAGILRESSLPLLIDVRRTVAQASTELERVDDLVGAAESLTGTVDSASKLAYLALSNPVVKVMAFGTGTARAARRLRRRGE